MNDVLQDDGRKQLTPGLWPAAAAKSARSSDMKRRELSLAEINPRGAFEVADMITGASVDETQMGRASKNAVSAADIDLNEMLKGGPRRKVAIIAEKADSLGQIQKFEATGSRATVTRSCELSLKSVASGIT